MLWCYIPAEWCPCQSVTLKLLIVFFVGENYSICERQGYIPVGTNLIFGSKEDNRDDSSSYMGDGDSSVHLGPG